MGIASESMSEVSVFRKAVRYAGASIGPVGSAGVQFLLAFVLLHTLSRGAFGAFSFLLVASQFSWGLWSALFCAPLPILYNEQDGASRTRTLQALFSTNLLVSIAVAPIFGGAALLLGVPAVGAGLFAVYAALALLRWFARAHAYASGNPFRTMASDLVYAGTLGIATLLMFISGPDKSAGSATLILAYAALLVSAAAGLLSFGKQFLKQQFLGFAPRSIPHYAPIWKRYSGWSLLGVVTTEATANSHAYFVTALLGPTAFAPIAASALLIRPISVASNALTEFERAQMARAIGGGQIEVALGAARYFRHVLILTWLLVAALVAGLLWLWPHSIFPKEYDLRFMIAAGAMWMLVAGVRLLRTPESALLQAAGEFRPLAWASVASSGMSIVAVAVLLTNLGTLWSIAGILVGEIAYALWIWRQCRRWRIGRMAVAPRSLEVTA